jgi:hypothetical protein
MPGGTYSEVQQQEEERNDVELSTLNKSDHLADESGEDQYVAGLLSLQTIAANDFFLVEELQIYRASNIAIPLNYFMVGLVQGLVYPLLNTYTLALGATEAQQTTLLTLKELPSCFKIMFGFWSDNVPIGGLRRKPYLVLGWAFSSLSLLPLLLLSDLNVYSSANNYELDVNTNMNVTSEENKNLAHFIAPEGAPSMPLLSVCCFLWATGLWLADVMGDSLVAEKAKYETDDNRGNLQAICYILRGLGFLLMAPLSSMIYSAGSPFFVVLATVVMPLLLVYPIFALNERPPAQLLTTTDQVAELWKTACSKAVWQPMGFVYIFLTLYVTNSAWKQFLETVLDFTPNQLNALMILAGIMAFVGIVLYKLFLFHWSWRRLFVIGICLNGAFSALQLLLISGYTFGINPFVFALGDDAVRDLIFGTQYLPMVILMVNLVPTGIEGASYALFTTTWNVAGALSDSLSTVLLRLWDTSKETLQQGDMSGLTKLTLLTSVLQTLPVFFVSFLPRSAEELQSTNKEQDNSSIYSRLGGGTYLGIVFLSLVWTVIVGLMNIFHPGWMGES